MHRALARALVVVALSGCRGSNKDGAPASSAPSGAASPAPSASAPSGTPSEAPSEAASASKWSNKSTDALELVVAPNRAAWVSFEPMNGGYVLHRGDRVTRLPREWFGAGPPRRDLSISADGARLGVPELQTGAVLVYDTLSAGFFGRLPPPRPGSQGTLSADGKYVRWAAPGQPCSMTEIETKTLRKSCP